MGSRVKKRIKDNFEMDITIDCLSLRLGWGYVDIRPVRLGPNKDIPKEP